MCKKGKLAMVVLVTVLSFGVIAPAWAKTPKQIFDSSSTMLAKEKIAQFTGVIEVTKSYDNVWLKKNKDQAGEYTKNVSKIKIAGAWDLTDPEAFKLKLSAEPNEMTQISESMPFALSGVHFMSIGDVYYVFVKLLSAEKLPTFFNYDLNDYVNRWIEINKVGVLQELSNNSYVNTVNKLQSGEYNDGKDELIKLLVKNKPYSVVRLADGKIDGKSVYHFKLVVNPNGMKSFLKASSKSDIVQTLSKEDLKTFNKNLDKSLKKTVSDLQKVGVEVWVNKTSGKIVQMSVKNTSYVKGLDYNGKQHTPSSSTQTKFTIKFKSFGEPVDIIEPGNTLKLEEVIKQLMEKQSTATTTITTTTTTN